MQDNTNTPSPSRLLHKLLDKRRHRDYGFLFLIGAWPIVLWYLIGAQRVVTPPGFVGYWEAPNWTSLALLLPVILFAFRWATGKVAPVVSPRLAEPAPPIIDVASNQAARESLYRELRACMLARSNLYAALVLTAGVTLLDTWPVVYGLVDATRVKVDYWTELYLLPASISKTANIVFSLFAYLGQVAATFIGILAIVLFFRHNLFFVRHIYQRRWFQSGSARGYFQIDVNDIDRCFGFRPANDAFNTQVKGLMLAGAAMFMSRFAFAMQAAKDLPATPDSGVWQQWLPQLGFTVPGQWLMALFWLVALAIVALPAMVKLLPWQRAEGSDSTHQSIDRYLREFFSDANWPRDPAGNPESVDTVARKFARNSFWPTGDNRARVLFLFAYWVFLVILAPPVSPNVMVILGSLLLYGVFAYGLTWGTFAALRAALRYVDDLLVGERGSIGADAPHGAAQVLPVKLDVGVFISYRRLDSAPYARSICEDLQEHFYDASVFMDIESIQPGVRFGREIDAALARVEAVVVVIGRDWLSIEDAKGRPRLTNPDDMVRYEVASALKQHKRIFPVLVGGARMPGESDLPEPLKELSQFNAIELSDSRWDYDMGRLIDALKQLSSDDVVRGR